MDESRSTHHAPRARDGAVEATVDRTRRDTLVAVVLSPLALSWPQAGHAVSLSDLTQADAGNGVKTALERGATIAVALLGKEDGFWKNDAVRIALPEWLQKAEKVIKVIGRAQEMEALKLGVNRAAEQAVPAARMLLVDAVRSMSLTDAKAILTGGDHSVTTFFQDKTRAPLGEKFLPIVTGVTQKIGLAQQYNQLAAQLQKTGLVKIKPEQANVETHVTAKALDGLYFMIGEEEKKIRRDPAGSGSALLKKVFGALR
ncbi:MAG: DUF4197 domain-containing protein [Betaproteobacteria bacterium]|nr:DUF4197 domain-containing protein [Betaproteobacteria bacterium]